MMLVFLQIFSLMSLYGLMTAGSTIKRYRQRWQHEHQFLLTKQRLRHIEKYWVTTAPSCQIPVILATSIAKKPISWWQQYACSDKLNRLNYYFVVEVIDKEPCGVLEKKLFNQIVTVEYRRITLLSLSNETNGIRILLQSTIATLMDSASPCQGKPHRVILGRQGWREI